MGATLAGKATPRARRYKVVENASTPTTSSQPLSADSLAACDVGPGFRCRANTKMQGTWLRCISWAVRHSSGLLR